MIKYKVKDAAADLGVSNKEIIEILEKHCGVTKKTMTTLEESELDVIFDAGERMERSYSLQKTLKVRLQLFIGARFHKDAIHNCWV